MHDAPQRQQQNPAPSGKLSLTLIAAALAAALILAAVSAFGGGGDTGPAAGAAADDAAVEERAAEPAEPDAQLLALARRNAQDPYALGEANAPVVMIEYSDFQCPFCGKFARDTHPELVREYVDQGVLRIEWRQFPIFGAESEAAARAGYAAGQQGRFWEFHDVVYGEERQRNSGAFSPSRLVAMAETAGVPDLARFRADLETEEAKAAVAADTGEGYRLGVASTPAFLINGTPVIGAQPAEVFHEAVAQAVRQATSR